MAFVAAYFGELNDEAVYAQLNRDQKYKDIIKELDQRLHKYYFERSVLVTNGTPRLRLDYIQDAVAAAKRVNDINERPKLLKQNIDHLNAYDLWARAILRLILEVNHPVFANHRVACATRSAALSLVQDWGRKRETACIQAWRDGQDSLKSRKRSSTTQNEDSQAQKRKLEYNTSEPSGFGVLKHFRVAPQRPRELIDLCKEPSPGTPTLEERKAALLKGEIEKLNNYMKQLADEHDKEIFNFKAVERELSITTPSVEEKQAELEKLKLEVHALCERHNKAKEESVRVTNALVTLDKELKQAHEHSDLKEEMLRDYEKGA